MGEVVMFPGNNRETVPQSLDQVIEKVQDNKVAFADYLSNHMGMAVLERLMDEGIHLEEDMATDIILMMDSVTSLYYKAVGAEHDLQEISSTMYDIPNREEFINAFYDVYCDDLYEGD